MCCQMRDLIDYMETLSSRACIEKIDIGQVKSKQHLPSSAILLERYAYNIKGFFICKKVFWVVVEL